VTLALAFGSTLLAMALAGGGAGRADPLAAEVLALVARGDLDSLQRAAGLVPAPLRADPAFRAAAANRALARLLTAAFLREVSAASADGDEGLRAARALREEALDELRPLARAHPDDPAVRRALAVYLGLGGRTGELEVVAGAARRAGLADPWIDFAELSAATRGRPPEAAAVLLASFTRSHPGILPARMSLARAQLALGRRDDGLSTLDALLALDPDHEDAKALKATVLAPPPVKLDPPLVPAGPPPRTRPGLLPRRPAAPASGDSRSPSAG
jgi:tetratricopeptide (TPR) repeat protein